MKTHKTIKSIRLLALLCLCILFNQNIYGQKAVKKYLEIKAGLGVLSTYFKDKPKNVIPPLSVGAQYHFNEKISLEAYAAHSRSRASKQSLLDKVSPEWENRLTVVGLKAAVHTRNFESWDIYGGILFNFNTTRIKVLKGDADFMQDHLGFKLRSSNISFSGFVGTRYTVSPRIGLYGELGFGASLLNIGVNYSFKNHPLKHSCQNNKKKK